MNLSLEKYTENFINLFWQANQLQNFSSMAASQFPHPRTRIKETIFDIADRVRQVKRLKMMLEKNVDELKTIFSEEHASMIMMADDIDETIEIVVQLVRNINAWSQHESVISINLSNVSSSNHIVIFFLT